MVKWKLEATLEIRFTLLASKAVICAAVRMTLNCIQKVNIVGIMFSTWNVFVASSAWMDWWFGPVIINRRLWVEGWQNWIYVFTNCFSRFSTSFNIFQNIMAGITDILLCMLLCQKSLECCFCELTKARNIPQFCSTVTMNTSSSLKLISVLCVSIRFTHGHRLFHQQGVVLPYHLQHTCVYGIWLVYLWFDLN